VGCDVLLANHDDVARSVELDVTGEAAAWAIVLPSRLQVGAGTEHRARLTFAVPDRVAVAGSGVHFAVSVRRPEDTARPVELRGCVQIAERHDVHVLVTPFVSRSRRGAHHTVVVKNRGNVAERVFLDAKDEGKRLRLSLSEAQVHVLPGQEATAELSVRARWPYLGRDHARCHRLNVVARPDGAPAETAEATYFQDRARWRLLVTVASVLLAVIALVTWGPGKAPATTDEASGGMPTSAAFASSCPAAPAGDEGHVVISGFAFCPATTTVAVGTEVTWLNQDVAPHALTASSGAPEPFDSGTLNQGQAFTLRFGLPGTYSYYCRVHPGMTGAIRVTG
jgi:plastocyanin